MSDTLGLATFEPPRQARFLAIGGDGPRGYSEETARTIDAEIERTLEAAHARARETLTQKRATLEALAKLLIESEVVDREALTKLLAMPGITP